MSELALVSGDMQSAAAAAESAGGRARGADGADALATLAGALPGSTTAETVPELGDAWTTGVGQWADGVTAFGAAVEQLNDDAGSADTSAASWLLGTGPR